MKIEHLAARPCAGDDEGRCMPEDAGLNEQENVFRCPRCLREVAWSHMARHLWDDHRLVLDGQRVREPWALIKEWVKGYAGKGPGWLLVRCRQLAEAVDPEHGARRVQRLLLMHGIEDREAKQSLLTEASANLASICPKCFNLVPCPPTISFQPAVASRGRVSARGYTVQIMDRGFVSRLVIETPGGVVYEGLEPRRALTFSGKALLLVGPFVLAAVIAAFVLRWRQLPSLLPVCGLLLMALVIFVVLQLRRGRVPDASHRAMDHAWTQLAPRLHGNGFSVPDAEFLAALALSTSSGLGNRRKRKKSLQEALRRTATAISEDPSLACYLAPLWRLVVEDRARADRDAADLVVREIGLCFEGKLRLTFVEQLLAGWDFLSISNPASPGRGFASRCRVLVYDRAFETGLEVRDLYFAGVIAPALGRLFATEDLVEVMHYRLLWSLRSSCPWDRFGQAETAFQIAADRDRGERILSERPDLLLLCKDVPDLYLGTRGVVFRDTVFTERPATIAVRAAPAADGDAYVLALDDHRFHFGDNPERYVSQLERWFRYFLEEFRPHVRSAGEWRAPVPAAMLDDPGLSRCSTCRRLIVPQPGLIAIAADELSEIPQTSSSE